MYRVSRTHIWHLSLLGLACFLNSIIGSTSSDYFKDKPDFLTPCKIYQPGFTPCSTANTQRLISEIAKGIPEVDAKIGSIDPITLKDINFRQENTESASIRADLTKLKATGLKGLVIKESRLQGHYKMNGRILLLPLSGSGQFFIEIDGMDIIMRTKTTLIEIDGLTFYNITNIKVELDISKLRTEFDGLFGGTNKEVERSTNESFNKNWREFFEALRPLINETVESVLYDILHPAFLLIPANFMVEDIPSPDKLYGRNQ